MLNITKDLIEHFKLEKSSFAIIKSSVYCILKKGNKEDADALFDYYLSNPFTYKSTFLFPIFRKFGDELYAQKLFNLYKDNPKEVEESSSEILELLGHFKYDGIKEILAKYAFGENGDYYLNRSAVLGLLHFDCSEYAEKIKLEISKCYNKGLFPEYMPALVCKLEHQEPILEDLLVLGNQYASTDCNAGIVLGFSLCGEIGRPYFMKALRNPHWEVDSSGTGTIWATYEGTKNLNISFNELYQEFKVETDPRQLRHLVSVLLALLDSRINDHGDNLTRFIELHHQLFAWKNKNESGNLIDFARKVDQHDQAYALERMLELKMTEELILEN